MFDCTYFIRSVTRAAMHMHVCVAFTHTVYVVYLAVSLIWQFGNFSSVKIAPIYVVS